MAGSAFFALIDDIATVLDDVSLMTKVAAKKTAGVLGDDLALNAQQVAGVRAERELPVVWAVAKGSLKNKAILVPAALAISAFIPWAVTPLLMLGGAFLCFEGFEKLAHKYLPHDEEHHEVAATAAEDVDPLVYEQEKIKDAVRTDFILSAEIIAITLGTVAGASLQQQITVLVGIALIMTAGVYGLVAGIVKLDDGGLYLVQHASASAWGRIKAGIGRAVLAAAPKMMRSLSVIGTIAMFMVGGGILTHGLPFAHHAIEAAAVAVEGVAVIGPVLSAIAPAVLNALFGVVAGAVVLVVVKLAQRVLSLFRKKN
ncbi:DUF808 domain-containing protein [Herbaspirillum seropedicae]|uniref:DUF808 domain-containing protein n=1 Tax=Herbaspirillum seropedicae TaxID=964 RepID=UPI00111E6BB5|nr:DUF808 domain-containing protein [Herbaspirillum seropedicae]QDD63053.1 DUF808 domain-containing protein [Herbaspirillum seropedicae]